MRNLIVAIACVLLLWVGVGDSDAQQQSAQQQPGQQHSDQQQPDQQQPDQQQIEPAQQKITKTFPAKQHTELPSIHQPDVGTGLIQVTLGLFVVLIIIGAAAWLTRRFGHFQTTAGGALRIVGGLHLSAREKLIVVQVGEEQLLLGVAPGRVSRLHVLSKPLSDTNEHIVQNSSFLDKLNSALKRNNT